jgi:hypothetical protein
MQTSLTHTGAFAHLILLMLLVCFTPIIALRDFAFCYGRCHFHIFLFCVIGFCGTRVVSRPVRSTRASARGPVRVSAAGSYQWLNKEPLALVIGFGG